MKKLITTFAAVSLIMGISQTNVAAKTINCKIVSSDGEKVTMDCGKRAKKLRKGDQVKVTKETEGC